MDEETLSELERLLTEMLAWAEARGEEFYRLQVENAEQREALKMVEAHCIDVFSEEFQGCQICRGHTLLTSERRLHRDDCPFAVLTTSADANGMEE